MRISDWSSDVCSSVLSAVSQVLACRFGGCIRSRARLHYSPALGVRDNDVFDDFYVERSGNLYQRACCNQVLLAVRRIPTGVIVNEDEARGVMFHRPAKDWPRLTYELVHRSALHLLIGNQPANAIQTEDTGGFNLARTPRGNQMPPH